MKKASKQQTAMQKKSNPSSPSKKGQYVADRFMPMMNENAVLVQEDNKRQTEYRNGIGSFLPISHVLERILMEHIEFICS